MDNKFLISIIVPAYNIADYLPRCLDSIINQTYKNLEIIVISDGSIDNTNEIITKYAEKDNRIVPILKENTGVSDTRNKGLDIAKGDYIGFVDGDDYIEQDMFEILLSNAVKYDVDISHCGYQMVFPSKVDYYYNTGKKCEFDNANGIVELIKAEYIEPGAWNKLYKRDLLKDIRFDTSLVESEDLLFNVQAFKKCNKSFYEDKPLYHYILRENSACTSSFNTKKTDNQISVLENIADILQEQIYNDIINRRYILTLINNYRTSCMESVPQASYKEKLKKVYREKKANDISKAKKIEVFFILKMNFIYKKLARIYKKCFYKNPYEVK